MPSNPAASAFFAACANSSMAALISASLIASGTGCGFKPSASGYIPPMATTAEGTPPRRPQNARARRQIEDMTDAPAVHQLDEYLRAPGVHRIGDALPPHD